MMTGPNWSLASTVASDRYEQQHIKATPGTGILVNQPTDQARQNLFTQWTYGDIEFERELMMPSGSNSGIYLQDRYEVQLLDSWGKQRVTFSDG